MNKYKVKKKIKCENVKLKKLERSSQKTMNK